MICFALMTSLTLVQAPPPATPEIPSTGEGPKTRRELLQEARVDPHRADEFKIDTGLMIGGGATMGVGVLLAGVGGMIYPVEGLREYPPPTATGLLIGGGVTAGVGLVVLAVGSVRRLNLIHERGFSLAPSVGLTHAGLQARFRF